MYCRYAELIILIMKLSETTIEILKNFSTINQGLIVKKGSVIKTLSPNETIKAEALIDEHFDIDFAVYDLTKTLALLSMNKDNPQIDLNSDHIAFYGAGGNGKIRQRYSSPNLISGYNKLDRNINITDFDVTIELSEEMHKWIFSVAAILKCPNIVVVGEAGQGVRIFAQDVKGAIVDDASVLVDGTVKDAFKANSFKAVFKIENFKILPGAYKIEISSKGISRFCHKNKPVLYWIPLESKESEFTL